MSKKQHRGVKPPNEDKPRTEKNNFKRKLWCCLSWREQLCCFCTTWSDALNSYFINFCHGPIIKTFRKLRKNKCLFSVHTQQIVSTLQLCVTSMCVLSSHYCIVIVAWSWRPSALTCQQVDSCHQTGAALLEEVRRENTPVCVLLITLLQHKISIWTGDKKYQEIPKHLTIKLLASRNPQIYRWGKKTKQKLPGSKSLVSLMMCILFCWITACCLTHHPCGIPLTSPSCSHVFKKKVIKRSGTNTHQI